MHIKTKICLPLLSLPLLFSHAFADNDVFYCPPTATCTGNTLSSCTVDNNNKGWFVEAYGAVPPDQIKPGVYKFSAATGAVGSNPMQQSLGCTYGNAAESISLHASIPTKTVYAVYTQLGNAWTHMSGNYQYCTGSVAPGNCPMSLNAGPSK